MSTRDPGPPSADEYAAYYAKYVSLVPPGDILGTLARQAVETLGLLRDVSEADSLARQPPYTWSFKEVVGHLTDSERVFAYRALRIARDDPTPLAGFEQDDYGRAANFDARPLADLTAEFAAVREATLGLFRNLDGPAWLRRGTANGSVVTVRALGHVIAGHERHHAAILGVRVRRLGLTP